MVNTNTPHVYKPLFSRLFFSFVGLPILAILIAWGSRLLFDFFRNGVGDLGQRADFVLTLIFSFVVVNFAFLLINKNQFVITVELSSVSGPSRTSLLGNQKTLAVENLDTEKLLQRTFWERFWQEKVIWSKDREKIVISRLCFSKEQEKEILQDLLSLSNKPKEQ